MTSNPLVIIKNIQPIINYHNIMRLFLTAVAFVFYKISESSRQNEMNAADCVFVCLLAAY